MSQPKSHSLARYLAARLGVSVVLLFGVTVVTFVLTRLVPADPVQAALGERAAGDPQIVARFREEAGLDLPLPMQYWRYLTGLLQGDLGTSVQTRQPVAKDLAAAFPATVELATLAMTIAIVIGVGLGLIAAMRHNKAADHTIRTVSLAGLSVPSFWLALVAFYLFFYKWRIAPGAGRLTPSMVPPTKRTGLYTIDALLDGRQTVFFDALEHLLLPALVMALYSIGLLTRFTRSAVLEVLSSDYVKAARAKGLPTRKVVFGYVLRAALVPVITVAGLAFGSLLAGTVLIERIFSWNGLGQYAFLAATKLDLPAVMGVGLLVGVIFITINFVVDILYGVIDPRVRVGR